MDFTEQNLRPVDEKQAKIDKTFKEQITLTKSEKELYSFMSESDKKEFRNEKVRSYNKMQKITKKALKEKEKALKEQQKQEEEIKELFLTIIKERPEFRQKGFNVEMVKNYLNDTKLAVGFKKWYFDKIEPQPQQPQPQPPIQSNQN